MRLKSLLAVGLVVVMATGSLGASFAAPPRPARQSGDWPTSTPEEQGMDSALLAEAIIAFDHQTAYNIHSLHIIRNGVLVTETYFYPYQADVYHDVASVTKSVMATLVGAAVQQGYLPDLHQPVISYFPDRAIAHLDNHKRAMTLADLLTMRSGLACVPEPELTLFEMLNAADWVQFVLDLPMQEAPGQHFVYCSPSVHLLGAIVQQAVGQPLAEFARTVLFEPLGITDYAWPVDAQGLPHGWGDLRLHPSDMAKLGQLYLNGGTWQGQQILAPDWVALATQVPADFDASQWAAGSGYAYLWWLEPGIYYARGRGGQIVAVLPALQLVIALTGGGGTDELATAYAILQSKVLPAVIANQPLPANPDGLAALEQASTQVAVPDERPIPVAALAPLADTVSGQTFLLEPNLLGLSTYRVTTGADDTLMMNLASADATDTVVVGMDGHYRWFVGDYGIPARARGQWTAANVLVVELDEVGNINGWTITATFEGDRVRLEIVETHTGNVSASLIGHRQP